MVTKIDPVGIVLISAEGQTWEEIF